MAVELLPSISASLDLHGQCSNVFNVTSCLCQTSSSQLSSLAADCDVRPEGRRLCSMMELHDVLCFDCHQLEAFWF